MPNRRRITPGVPQGRAPARRPLRHAPVPTAYEAGSFATTFFLLGAYTGLFADRAVRASPMGFQQSVLDYGLGDGALVVDASHVLFEFKRERAGFAAEVREKAHRTRLVEWLAGGAPAGAAVARAEAGTLSRRVHLGGYGAGPDDARRIEYAPYVALAERPAEVRRSAHGGPYGPLDLAHGLLRFPGHALARAVRAAAGRPGGAGGRDDAAAVPWREAAWYAQLPALGADHATFVRYARFVLEACRSASSDETGDAQAKARARDARAEAALDGLAGYWVAVDPRTGRVGHESFEDLGGLQSLVARVEALAAAEIARRDTLSAARAAGDAAAEHEAADRAVLPDDGPAHPRRPAPARPAEPGAPGTPGTPGTPGAPAGQAPQPRGGRERGGGGVSRAPD